MSKNTYGTGCFLLQNIGTTPTRIEAATRDDGRVADRRTQIEYALEGSVFIGGAVVQWLRDGLGLIRNAAEIEALAASVPTTAASISCRRSPASARRTGIHYARGTIVGITRGTTSGAHRARGAREHRVSGRRLLDAMDADSGIRIEGTARGRRRLRRTTC